MLVLGKNRRIDITGDWNEDANAWVSDVVGMNSNAFLEIDLPSKGILVIKKSEKVEGPWPKAMTTKWTGPKIRIRIYGSTTKALLKFCLTSTPTRIQLVRI